MAGIEKDKFTDSTRGLLNRMHLALSDNIQSKKRDLEFYKKLGDQPENHELVELAEDKLTQLKADLEQLKNL